MKYLHWILIAAFLYFVPPFCKKQTDGFTLSHIQSDLAFNPAWEIELPPREEKKVQEILSQPFHYLACGGQAYVFESADGNYVVKFFKHHYRKPQTWLLALPLPEPFKSFRDKKEAKILSKLNRDFGSCKLAFEELKEETGLLYIHLNKSHHLNQSIQITDKIGINHRLDLDSYEFILQEKGEMLYPHLAQLMENHQTEAARQAIDSILSLIISRCEKGIFDEDACIHRNLGFKNDQAIFIDTGRFKVDPERQKPEVYNQDLLAITQRLNGWLAENYPPLSEYLEKRLSDKMAR